MLRLASFLVICLVLSGGVRSETPDLSTFSVPERDLARRVMALRSSDPQPLLSGVPDPLHHHCGTLRALSLRAELEAAPASSRQKLAVLFQRPNRTFSRLSASGRFRVHYDTSGSHAVNTTDADGNGHPDYVDEVAEVFDEVWSFEVDQLGYRSPPRDGNTEFDIYIKDLGTTGQYGLTFPEAFTTTSATYIEIDNDYADPIYVTNGLDALRFTAAHEFFHAVQFGYYLSIEAAWWYELTATWIQDEMFTEVNDHYSLVNGYLEQPEASFYEPPPVSFRPYGAMIFADYLASVYGDDVIRRSFEDLGERTPNPYRIQDADAGLPGGFTGVLPRYWIWNYLTGSRARPGLYHAEASGYDEAASQQMKPIGSLTLGGSAQVQSLGATYARIETAGLSGGIHVSFTLPAGPTWNLDVLLIGANGVEVLRPEGLSVTIPSAASYEEVVFIPSVLSLEGQVHNATYTFRVSDSLTGWSDLVGDIDHSGDVGFTDFILFSGSFGQPADTHDVRCDLDGDGRVDFTDFLVFVSHFGESR